MRRTRTGFIAGLTALSALAAATLLTSSAAALPATRSAGLLAIDTGDMDSTSDPSRYAVIVLRADEYARIPALRAANPGVTILSYKNSLATNSYSVTNGVDAAVLSTGVGYADASSNHPEWFLLDPAGSRVQFCDFTGKWFMDMGLGSYQDAWADAVSAFLAKYDFDGVMADDVNDHLSHLCTGKSLAKYPDSTSFAAASESFLARVGPKIVAAGKLFVPNIALTYSPDWKERYTRYVSHGSGALREYWMKPGRSTGNAVYSNGDWNYLMAQMAVVEGAGKLYLPVTYGAMTETATIAYSRASFLLGWNGGASASIWSPNTKSTDPWSPLATTDLGAPLGARYAVGSAWRRDFKGGTVVVNPSSTLTATVALGASYVGPSGDLVTSVTLKPATAVLLALPATSPSPSSTASPSPTPSPSPSPTPTASPSPSPSPSPTRTKKPPRWRGARIVVRLIPAVRLTK